jgi:hypothetical protein
MANDNKATIIRVQQVDTYVMNIERHHLFSIFFIITKGLKGMKKIRDKRHFSITFILFCFVLFMCNSGALVFFPKENNTTLVHLCVHQKLSSLPGVSRRPACLMYHFPHRNSDPNSFRIRSFDSVFAASIMSLIKFLSGNSSGTRLLYISNCISASSFLSKSA